MLTSEFHYDLPADLIAHHPAPERDGSRLLVLDRTSGSLEHRRFRDLPDHLRADDLLVFNDSRVIPARLRGVKAGSGGAVEVLLLAEEPDGTWGCLLRPGKRVRPGTRLEFHDANGRPGGLAAEVVDKDPEGHCRLRFDHPAGLPEALERIGETPLPPYIRPSGADPTFDRERYQTVYARSPGSVAAPTAGLHFTPALLETIRARGIETAFVTLHVGAGTFLPVKSGEISAHRMHSERFHITPETAATLDRARRTGRRIVAVGTTTVRVLETLASRTPSDSPLPPGPGSTDIFLHPPARFRLVGALVTNFHLPESTLLMLVSAFAEPGGLGGRERILAAYREAISHRYRFYSYGDAMLIQ